LEIPYGYSKDTFRTRGCQSQPTGHQIYTKYGQAPRSWAANRGHEATAKKPLERTDVGPAMPVDENQTPPSLALSEENHGVARILLEQANPDSEQTSHGGHTSFPATPRDELCLRCSLHPMILTPIFPTLIVNLSPHR